MNLAEKEKLYLGMECMKPSSKKEQGVFNEQEMNTGTSSH